MIAKDEQYRVAGGRLPMRGNHANLGPMVSRDQTVILASWSCRRGLPLIGAALAFVVGCDHALSPAAKQDASTGEGADGSGDSIGDVSADDANGCVPAPAGVVAWWSGDDTLADRTGAHPLTASAGGTFAFAEGKVGKGFLLTGGAYLATPHNADLFLDTGFSIEAWVHAFSYGGRVVDHITAYVPDGYLLDTYGSRVRGYAGNQGVSGATPLPPDAWVHLATTFDPLAGTLSVYLDGVLDGAAPVSGAGFSHTKPLRLGADSVGGSLLSGILDEVTLYDRPLTDAELLAIASAGAAGKCKR